LQNPEQRVQLGTGHHIASCGNRSHCIELNWSGMGTRNWILRWQF